MQTSDIVISDPKILILAFLGGIIPSLLWLWFWLKEEEKGKSEPSGLLAICFIVGMISVFFVLPLEKFIQNNLDSHGWQIIGCGEHRTIGVAREEALHGSEATFGVGQVIEAEFQEAFPGSVLGFRVGNEGVHVGESERNANSGKYFPLRHQAASQLIMLRAVRVCQAMSSRTP